MGYSDVEGNLNGGSLSQVSEEKNIIVCPRDGSCDNLLKIMALCPCPKKICLRLE